MGIATVAVYSDADKNALFVQQADEAIHIGGSQAAESYLNVDKIIAAAQQTAADAIHPGYGFLAENASFARLCADAGIIFIGPNPQAIEVMGSKIRAKTLMQKQGVPTIAGYKGQEQSVEVLMAEAKKIGFPVLLKASAGGGGKGMRIVRKAEEITAAIEAAKREAKSAFGDDTLLIEQYFDSARHIEFQILGDQHGHIIHCFERECSIQRRYQKIIEETPSPALNDALRQQMGAAAVAAAKAIHYDNAGTVEFILAPDNSFYFLEVNTRLQVEHPVTEMVTGLDLVQLQIEIAEGKPLSITQEALQQRGHAIECRIYAEDAANQFLPATGKIELWQIGKTPDIRYDTGVETASHIDIFYDPMIAKVIAHAPNRAAAIRKMQRALQELVLLGITSNKDFLIAILQNETFRTGNFDTHFLAKAFDYQILELREQQQHYLAIAATLWQWQNRQQTKNTLPHIPSGWRNNFYQAQQQSFQIAEQTINCAYQYEQQNRFSFSLAEQNYTTELLDKQGHNLTILINNHRITFTIAETANELFIHQNDMGTAVVQKVPRFPEKEVEAVKGGYLSPMPGEIIKVLVAAGNSVKSGDPLLIILSMKMENTIEAHEDGIVEEIYVAEKSFVEADTLLLKMKS